MSKDILKLKPESLWRNFYSLTEIPRPSKNEEKVRAFMESFGEDHGLETIVDKIGNVIIRKPATKGMENRKGVVLQGHIDMVPQKNSNKKHDFLVDPIDAWIDGDWVKARGTTLGADNGIGVAAAMAVLESKDLAHGPLEALFTIDEETGMTGANKLEPGILKGDILINMDSEDEGELYVGCAGGVDTNALLPAKREEVPPYMLPYRISVTGLKGGHSGLDIHLGRGNANKIMNSLLMKATRDFSVRLATIDGGSLRNAIPRESFAVIVVPEKQKDALKEMIVAFEQEMKESFKKADPGLMINIETTRMPKNIIDMEAQKKMIQAVDECPNGVISMSKDMPGVVETSSNLAIIKSVDKGIEFASLQRSQVDADKEKLANEIAKVFANAGAKVDISGDYPGWKPNMNSAILKEMKEIYNKHFGKIPEVKVIHAGLECGILGAKYPNWDMISFGPTIRNPHSPDEMVNIHTVQMFWDFLVETLKNIPEK